MSFENGTGARILTATGEEFVPYTLTPEREDTILQAISKHHGAATTGQVAAALGRNIPDASRLLQEMAERGKVVGTPGALGRVEWRVRDLNIDESLVRQAHVPRIREYLLGRRELPGAIATALRLPRNEVEATCTWMMVHGQLVGTPIGASIIYGLEARVTARVDTKVASSIPMSPEARFREQLAKLGPEKPIRLRQVPAPKPARVKAEPKPKPVKVAKVKTPRPVREKPAKAARPQPAPRVRPPAEPVVRPPTQRQLKAAAAQQRREEQQRKRDEANALKESQQRLRQETMAARRQAVLDRQAQREQARQAAVERQGQREAARVQREQARQAAAVQRQQQQAEREARIRAQTATLTGDEQTPQAWATQIGVRADSLHKWIAKHPDQRQQCTLTEKDLLVPARVITAYQQATTPRGATWSNTVPEGSLTIWEARDLLGWGHNKVYRALFDGEISAVQAHGRLRFNRAELEALKAPLDEELKVPDGWVAVLDLARELAVHPASLHNWLEVRGIQVVKYRNASRQLAWHLPGDAAEAYRAHRRTSPGVPVQTRRKARRTAPEPLPSPAPDPLPAPRKRVVITTEIDRQLRALLTPERRRIPGETARVAEQFGLSVKQVRYHLQFTPITKEAP